MEKKKLLFIDLIIVIQSVLFFKMHTFGGMYVHSIGKTFFINTILWIFLFEMIVLFAKGNSKKSALLVLLYVLITMIIESCLFPLQTYIADKEMYLISYLFESFQNIVVLAVGLFLSVIFKSQIKRKNKLKLVLTIGIAIIICIAYIFITAYVVKIVPPYSVDSFIDLINPVFYQYELMIKFNAVFYCIEGLILWHLTKC